MIESSNAQGIAQLVERMHGVHEAASSSLVTLTIRAVAQLVARIVRDDEAGGSIPLSPTKKFHFKWNFLNTLLKLPATAFAKTF